MTAPSDNDLAFVAQVVRMHGGQADRILSLSGGVNRVLRVSGGCHDWVVRFPVDPRRPNEFPTEIWAARQASMLGIETPRVLATGYLDDRPYLVVEYIAPEEDLDIDHLWWWLGRYSAVLATAPLDQAPDDIFSRFGRDLSSAWRSHLRYNLDELSARDPLITDGVYQRRDRDRLYALLEPLEAADFAFGLAHGDLAPRNLIPRPTPFPPVLIDWGTATTGPTPWTDLQQVYVWAVHDHTISHRALHQFADGADLPVGPRETAILTQLTALRYLDLARWSKQRRPDLYGQYRQSSMRGLEAILEVS